MERAAFALTLDAQQVMLEGPSNFRDLGGYPAAGGGCTRRGVVYRSDGLALLTDADVQCLTELGVTLVCDLRGPHEEAEAPTRAHEISGARVCNPAIGDGSEQRVQLIDRIRSGDLTAIGVDDMVAFYLLTLDHHAREIGEVLGHLADPDNHAVVFHCTAGKDRTGLIAALLLDVLGTPRDAILADYALTNEARSGRRAALRAELDGLGVDFDAFAPFFTAQPAVLSGTLAALHDRYGTSEQYLAEVGGLDREHVDSLRAHLVVRP